MRLYSSDNYDAWKMSEPCDGLHDPLQCDYCKTWRNEEDIEVDDNNKFVCVGGCDDDE